MTKFQVDFLKNCSKQNHKLMQPMSGKFRDCMDCWKTNSVSAGASRIIPPPLRKYRHFQTCTATRCNVSRLCYARCFRGQFGRVTGRSNTEH